MQQTYGSDRVPKGFYAYSCLCSVFRQPQSTMYSLSHLSVCPDDLIYWRCRINYSPNPRRKSSCRVPATSPVVFVSFLVLWRPRYERHLKTRETARTASHMPLPLPGSAPFSWAMFRQRVGQLFNGADPRVCAAFWLFGALVVVLTMGWAGYLTDYVQV